MVARHLGYNAVLQAYKTHSLLGASEAIVVCFELVCFHPYRQMKKNMFPKGSQARTETEKDGKAAKQWWRYMFVLFYSSVLLWCLCFKYLSLVKATYIKICLFNRKRCPTLCANNVNFSYLWMHLISLTISLQVSSSLGRSK